MPPRSRPGHDAGARGRSRIGPLEERLLLLPPRLPAVFGVHDLAELADDPAVLIVGGWQSFWCREVDAAGTKAAGATLLLPEQAFILEADPGAARAIARSGDTTPIPTVRCFQMRLSVSSVSYSST